MERLYKLLDSFKRGKIELTDLKRLLMDNENLRKYKSNYN